MGGVFEEIEYVGDVGELRVEGGWEEMDEGWDNED